MKGLNVIIPAVAALLLAGQAAAQTSEDARERATAAPVTERAEVARTVEVREAEVRRKLQAAEERMAEAARQIAELTSERLPRVERFRRQVEIFTSDKPRLGVAIGGDGDGPVAGVQIVAVTPGTAASDAGLRAGDVITAVNGDSMSADSADAANDRLVDFMDGVEEGDTLDVEYLRDGKSGKVEVEPRPVENNVFAFRAPGQIHGMPAVPDVHVAPGYFDGSQNRFFFNWRSDGLGDMELVELNEGLGRYFGTDEGLLVVSAPESDNYELEDGDVIQKIDGRTPTSVRHAMRILGSYQAGESLKLQIMRDKKRRTLEIEIPDDRTSMLAPAAPPAVQSSSVPVAPRPRPAIPLEKT